MKHTYHISGMSGDDNRKKVEQTLNAIPGVVAVVTLDPPEAVITMDKHVPTELMQEALSKAGNYTIEMQMHQHHAEERHSHKHADHDHGNTGVKHQDKGSSKYTCPMHPEIIRDQPGACPICGMDLVPMATNVGEEDETYNKLLLKFKVAAIFTIPIFLIAMSEMLPGNPLYKLMDPRYWNWVQLVLSLPVVFYATWMFFQRAWLSIITWKLNMFTLIGIGAGVAWLFSVVALFFPGIFPAQFRSHHGTVYVYFEAATVILTLVLLGQLLEARAHGKTNSAIKELLKLAPNNATKIIDDKEIQVAIDEIQKGDLLRVKPGEKIPVDGSIKTGEAIIDESMISGEPVPVEKGPGDKVSSGTINGNKTFVMLAEKVGSETLLSQIIEMVNTASRSKAPIQKMADKISGYFVPVVVLIAIATFVIWAIFGPEPSYVYAFVNAIAVLIIACPCALGLATPMSVMVGVGKGAQSGVLIKNAESLEKMNAIDVLVIDKTGTVTEGKPSVEKVASVNADFSEADMLQKIVALNSSSEHPLAQATLRYGAEKKVKALPLSDFEAITGKGVTGVLNADRLALGNRKLMEQVNAEISPELEHQVTAAQKQGKTVSYLAVGKMAIGYIVISDKIKASAKVAIQKLQQEGLQVIMFTGDNEDTARAVSETLSLDGFKAQMLPENKLNEIKKLQSEGKKVAMAGDGINDAPALSQADIGIAMGTGTDVAIESAAITLVKGDMNGIAKARLLSHKVMGNIKGNLFFALGYNVLGIPVAAGLLYPMTGILLSPMIAALAMSFSSVSVILNSLRLRSAKVD
jgi:P-type Cu+ transporter